MDRVRKNSSPGQQWNLPQIWLHRAVFKSRVYHYAMQIETSTWRIIMGNQKSYQHQWQKPHFDDRNCANKKKQVFNIKTQIKYSLAWSCLYPFISAGMQNWISQPHHAETSFQWMGMVASFCIWNDLRPCKWYMGLLPIVVVQHLCDNALISSCSCVKQGEGFFGVTV